CARRATTVVATSHWYFDVW
nr:immunoglobulin heavy chain junction region [Mus musculus]